MRIYSVEEPGRPSAIIWIERRARGPSGRPLLFFNSFDPAADRELGDADDVHTDSLVDRDAIPPGVLEQLERFESMSMEGLADLIAGEQERPWFRQLAYNVYLDMCTTEELQERNRWLRSLNPDDSRAFGLAARN
jgi:hypothetical protein